MILCAVTNGFLDDVPVDKVQAWEAEFHASWRTRIRRSASAS